MAVRSPLYWDGSALKEMSTAQVNEIVNRAIYLYGSNPSANVTVVASGGNISPNMIDTRLTSGAAATSTTASPAETTTEEPRTAQVTFDKISQSNTSVSTPTDTNNKAYPVYYDGSDIRAMNATDIFDTFIDPAIDDLVDGSDRSGTYRIHTSTSLSGHTLISATPVFTDTRADTSEYLESNIGTSGTIQDIPETINNYYVFRTDQGSAPSFTKPLQIDTSNNLQEYTNSAVDSMILAELRHHTVNTVGSRILYSVNGTGNNRGTAIANTILDGNGDYQTRFVGDDDYRAQEFPNGTATTASTWFLRITRG